jgi:thiamine-phosphate pyrophosphorylase
VIARGAWPALVLVTDPAFPDDRIVAVVLAVGAGLPAGSFAVQLRDKARDRASVASLAARLRERTLALGVALIINGDAALAHEVGADGVHLGRDAGTVEAARRIAGEAAWISVAAHDDADVERARDALADAVLVSPIFATPGKGPPRGTAALGRAKALAAGGSGQARLGVYALGGVDGGRAELCRAAGADGVAVVRALLAAPDPLEVARALVGPARQD